MDAFQHRSGERVHLDGGIKLSEQSVGVVAMVVTTLLPETESGAVSFARPTTPARSRRSPPTSRSISLRHSCGALGP
jgi:hypothetical protein